MSFAERLRSIADLEMGRAQVRSAPAVSFAGRATRNDFLAWLYANGFVRADAFTAHLSDKLFFAKLLEAYAPEAYARFHPRTCAPGDLGPDPAAALRGCEIVAKPAAAMNGEGGVVHVGTAAFLTAWRQDPAAFGGGEEPSPLTGLLSSGARYLVQERVRGAGPEFRLHTLDGRVVAGATFTRWDEPAPAEAFTAAEAALQTFLDLLPGWLKIGQAWSVDLLESDAGYRLIEVNTNRGEARQWSGDLSLPDLLQAYTWHLDEFYGDFFSGIAGEELRAGRANLGKFAAKFGPDAWERHRALRQISFPERYSKL